MSTSSARTWRPPSSGTVTSSTWKTSTGGPGIGVVNNQLHVGESELHFTVRDEPAYMEEGHPAFEIRDWKEMIAHLVQNGVQFERGGPTYRPDGSTAAFFRDLEGNLLEIVNHPTGRRWARDN